MGLRPLPAADWIEVDGHYEADLARKRALLREHRDQVLAVVDDPDGAVRAASQELLDRLVLHLGEHHRTLAPAVPVDLHPIDAAGRLTQEDWCVHLPDEQGRWRLVAASVCFPTRWDLRTKIGRTLRQIHAPVPLYEEQLADPMDAYFGRMRPEQAVWRLNWNLLDDATLHQPFHRHPTAPPPQDRVGELLWMRVERQTLLRLPATGAIVFGIRIHLDPLASLAGDPDGMARLSSALEQLPAEVLEDKALTEIAPAVQEWLAGRQGQNSVRSASRAPRSTS
jgi:hypothetical protein